MASADCWHVNIWREMVNSEKFFESFRSLREFWKRFYPYVQCNKSLERLWVQFIPSPIFPVRLHRGEFWWIDYCYWHAVKSHLCIRDTLEKCTKITGVRSQCSRMRCQEAIKIKIHSRCLVSQHIAPRTKVPLEKKNGKLWFLSSITGERGAGAVRGSAEYLLKP